MANKAKEKIRLPESTGPVGANDSVGSRVFDALNYIIVGLVAITTILPFIPEIDRRSVNEK